VAGDKYVDQLKDTIQFSMPKGRCGAFFAEPIQVLYISMYGM